MFSFYLVSRVCVSRFVCVFFLNFFHVFVWFAGKNELLRSGSRWGETPERRCLPWKRIVVSARGSPQGFICHTGAHDHDEEVVVRGLVVEHRSQDLCLCSYHARWFVPLPSSSPVCGSPRPRPGQRCSSPSGAGALKASVGVSKEHRGSLILIGLNLTSLLLLLLIWSKFRANASRYLRGVCIFRVFAFLLDPSRIWHSSAFWLWIFFHYWILPSSTWFVHIDTQILSFKHSHFFFWETWCLCANVSAPLWFNRMCRLFNRSCEESNGIFRIYLCLIKDYPVLRNKWYLHL